MSDAKTHDILPAPKRITLYGGDGFVELIDVMPRVLPVGRTADLAVVQNARVSLLSDAKTQAEDDRLIRYLMNHRHTSPFESVVFKFRMRIPIFVERQLVRHRTASLNEASYRYTAAPDAYHYPALRLQSTSNRQASDPVAPVPDAAQKIYAEARRLNAETHRAYQRLLELGIAREVARVVLPVSLMTELVWSANLHNTLHFLGLRMAVDAQAEIRELAIAMYKLIQQLVPVTCDAWTGMIRERLQERTQARSQSNASK